LLRCHDSDDHRVTRPDVLHVPADNALKSSDRAVEKRLEQEAESS
jgi:hypothetical protein